MHLTVLIWLKMNTLSVFKLLRIFESRWIQQWLDFSQTQFGVQEIKKKYTQQILTRPVDRSEITTEEAWKQPFDKHFRRMVAFWLKRKVTRNSSSTCCVSQWTCTTLASVCGCTQRSLVADVVLLSRIMLWKNMTATTLCIHSFVRKVILTFLKIMNWSPSFCSLTLLLWQIHKNVADTCLDFRLISWKV